YLTQLSFRNLASQSRSHLEQLEIVRMRPQMRSRNYCRGASLRHWNLRAAETWAHRRSSSGILTVTSRGVFTFASEQAGKRTDSQPFHATIQLERNPVSLNSLSVFSGCHRKTAAQWRQR